MSEVTLSQLRAQIGQLKKQLKASEILSNRLFESSPNCVKVLDLDGRLLQMNANGLKAMEVDDFEPYRQADWLSFWQGEYRLAARQALAAARAGHSQSFQGIAHTAKGKLKWWDVTVSPVFNEQQVEQGQGEQQQVEQLLCVSQDISDRIQSERTLKTAQRQLESALFAGRIGIWHYDIVEDIATTDPQLASWFGVDPQTAESGLPIEDFLGAIHPQDRDRVTRTIEQSIAAIEDYKCEYRVRDANGKERYVLARGQTECDQQGQPTSFFGSVINITQRRKVEKELRASEQRTRKVLNSLSNSENLLRIALSQAHAGTWNWTIATGEVVWSLENYRLHGLDPARGPIQYEDWAATLYPEDRDWVNAEVARVLEQRAPEFRAEFRIVHPERGVRWLVGIGSLTLDEQGNPAQLSGLNLDITERKQAELQKLKNKDVIAQQLTEIEAIYHSAPIGLAILNQDLRFIRLNQQIAEMNGLSVEEHLGHTVREIVPEMADTVEPIFQTILQTGEPKLDLEIRGETPAQPGVERVWLGNWYPLKNASDEIVGINVVSQEITARKRAEQEREQLLAREKAAREEAETANRMKDEFLAIVSHELRTPLNPILGWSQLLSRGNLSKEKMANALETIMRNAKMQAQLIDDLLDVSRILRGKLTLQSAPVRLDKIVQAAIETVQLSAQAKSIDIHTAFDPDVNPVRGDAGRIQQIVWNILSNAIKFTPDGGRIDVVIQQSPKGKNNRAQLVVRDTGKGISADFLPHLFDRFRQQDSATTRQFGGLGLGLSISQHLVELHGGTLRATSPGEGQGSTFVMELPMMGSGAISTVEKPSKRLTFSDIKALVVDDHEDARDVAALLLTDVGISVEVASSAKEALAVMQQHRFDIIISDIGMPVTDGYQLIRQIRDLPESQGGQTPAICLTAFAGEIDLKRAKESGFQKHIAKPIERDALLRAIATVAQPVK